MSTAVPKDILLLPFLSKWVISVSMIALLRELLVDRSTSAVLLAGSAAEACQMPQKVNVCVSSRFLLQNRQDLIHLLILPPFSVKMGKKIVDFVKFRLTRR